MTPGGKRDKITGLYFVFQIILSLNYLLSILRKYNCFQLLIKYDKTYNQKSSFCDQKDYLSEKINCLFTTFSSFEIITYFDDIKHTHHPFYS